MLVTVVKRKLLAIVFLSFLASSTWAADLSIGEITFVQGSVDVVRAGGRLIIHAKTGTTISKGDTIKTGNGSKAAIKLKDESSVYVAANSNMELTDYNIDAGQKKRNGLVKAFAGKVRLAVSMIIKESDSVSEWKSTNFSIETPTAIAGVRGTDFVVSVHPGRTMLVVLEGVVSFMSISGNIGREVVIGANQSSNVKKNAPPAKPSTITLQQRQSIISETTPPQIAKKEGAGEPVSKDVKEMAVANDVAANKPMKVVIENAVDFGGLSVKEMIDTAIKAGADPAIVVYTAIAEGYMAAEVVQAAINAGAQLDEVFRAAASGGADTISIAEGAKTAGVPEPIIADSLANNTSPVPVYGYTPAENPTSAIATTPTSGIALISGPIATPGNTVASPSTP